MSRVMRLRRDDQRWSNPADGPARWIAWRVKRLLAAGFPQPLARRLAADERVDVHALLELIDRGCPPSLAARIMAPIDSDAKVS
ncbi:MAG: hypothetical protein ACRDPA_02510 [Solirubrobacteraceae bacterium]